MLFLGHINFLVIHLCRRYFKRDTDTQKKVMSMHVCVCVCVCVFRMRVERYIIYFTHLRMLRKTDWTYFLQLQMNIHKNKAKSWYVQKEVEVIIGISPNSAKTKILFLAKYPEATSKLIFSTFGDLVPEPRGYQNPRMLKSLMYIKIM